MKLEVAVTDLSPTSKELTVEVPVEEVDTAYDKALDEYTRYARIPGFRQGRAPRSVVRQRFSKELRDDVISRLLPPALSHAVADHKLHPIGDPDVRFDPADFRKGEPLRFGVQLEVIPEFELSPYRGIALTRHNIVITDDDLDRVVDTFRQEAAEFVTIDDRPAETGDFVSVNLIGKYVVAATDSAPGSEPATDQSSVVEPADSSAASSAGNPPEDLVADELLIEIGGQGVQPDFTINLTGVKAGDIRQFRVVYPADFTSPGLAGQTLDFTATVCAVRRKELPEITDENIGQFGRFESVEQMRRETREALQKRYNEMTEGWLRDDLIRSIITAYDFEIPAKFLQNQYSNRARDFVQRVFSSGLSPTDLAKIDLRKRMGQIQRSVANEIRSSLVLQRIGEAESVKITSEDVAAEIARRAAAEGVTEAELYDRLSKADTISSLETGLFYDTVLKHLLGLAQVSDVEITIEEANKRNQEADSDEQEGDQPDALLASANPGEDSPPDATGSALNQQPDNDPTT